jgi:MinD-like ATPase involved in chromosome partitioning or flagellar assembly
MTAATAEPAKVHGRISGHQTAVDGPYRPSAPAPARLCPLLSVCGLAGGVGVTTLAYLIARAAARQFPDPVLVADTGGPSGGLAACAGVEVPRSLGELAEQLADGAPLGAGIYGTGRDGLRVLAAGPEFAPRCYGNALRELVADAREAHGLTVIDCGTLVGEADQIVAADATHVAWMLNVTASGVERGRRVLDAAPRTAAKELIVARNNINQTRAPLRKLRRLAAERRALLVLMPHLARWESCGIESCADEAQVPVQAILGALRR